MPLIIGTAGHIDHGKTSLVRALTGQETDRLKEEQERGISIDLGFAHFDGPSGALAGVVDVPGHERFIRNMLAGAHGMDLVLFTVAADDGVMPQTEEHLDILHLLGVQRGIFVITKTDLVDAVRVAAVREEIEILALDTTLQDAPILPVSVISGAGLDALRSEIHRQLAAPAGPPPPGPFRLPVDRSFVIHGHGVVVTGTAIAGQVREGDSVRILPGGDTARVRGVEVHGSNVGHASHGQRVAINLGGIERSDIRRGHVVVAPGIDRTTDRFDAWVEVRPGARLPLRHHGGVRVHLGTSETVAKTVLLQGEHVWPARSTGYVQVVLAEPVLALRGDRFILRDETARWTLGGGVVLHPFAPRHRAAENVTALLTALHQDDPRAAALALLQTAPDLAMDRHTLHGILNLPDDAVVAALRGTSDVWPIPNADHPDAWITRTRAEALEARTLDDVASVHRTAPLEAGADIESLRTQLPWQVPPRVFRWTLDRLIAARRLIRDDNLVRLPTHKVALGSGARALGDRILPLLTAGGLTPPDLRQLETSLGVPQHQLSAVLGVLDKEKQVVRVAADLYYAPTAIATALDHIRTYCQAHGEITAAAFRDLIGASRKYAIALLDWTDRTGVTVRVGDNRKLRR